MVPEKRVCRVAGGGSRGTGLLVARDLVLTASHCVPSRDARTSFGAGRVVWRARRPDAALIRLDAPADVPGPLRWGRVVGGAPLVAHAIGFPRVSHPRAHRLEARLRPDFTLAPLTPPPLEDAWRGFSGAALFAGGLLVGVVTHTPEDWENRELLALPVATLMTDPSFARLTGAPALREVELERLQVPDVIARSPAMLLRADVEATTFQEGREEILAELDAWCAGAERQDALLVTGPGGQGKSRLGLEFGHRMRAKGWAVLHLRDDAPDLSPLTGVTTPLLVVVDYAERREPARLAEALPEREPVRVLMLARGDGGWRTNLPPHAALLTHARAIPLPELYERPPDVTRLAAEYTRGLRALGYTPAGDTPPPAKAGTALSVHLHVLAALLGGPAEAIDQVLAHEARYWTGVASRHGLSLSPGTMRGAVGTASLMPAHDRETALRILRPMPGLRDQPEDVRDRAAAWLRDLYPAGERWWGALQPDLLLEHLARAPGSGIPHVFGETYRAAAASGDPRQRLDFIGRVNAAGPGLVEPAYLRLLADLTEAPEAAPDLWTDLTEQCLRFAGRPEAAGEARLALARLAKAAMPASADMRTAAAAQLLAFALVNTPGLTRGSSPFERPGTGFQLYNVGGEVVFRLLSEESRRASPEQYAASAEAIREALRLTVGGAADLLHLHNGLGWLAEITGPEEAAEFAAGLLDIAEEHGDEPTITWLRRKVRR